MNNLHDLLAEITEDAQMVPRQPELIKEDIVAQTSKLLIDNEKDMYGDSSIPFFRVPYKSKTRSETQETFHRVARTQRLRQLHSAVYGPHPKCLDDLSAALDSLCVIISAMPQLLTRKEEEVFNLSSSSGTLADLLELEGPDDAPEPSEPVEVLPITALNALRIRVAQHPVLLPVLSPSRLLALKTLHRTPPAPAHPAGEVAVARSSLESLARRAVGSASTRVGLSVCDAEGRGLLGESDLENYVEDLVSSLDHLRTRVDGSFRPFYVCTVVRGLLFFLGKGKSVKLLDLLASPHLAALLTPGKPGWFSVTDALDLYTNYVRADLKHDGLLSIAEASGLRNGGLSRAFIERVFACTPTFDGKLDYRGYVDMSLLLSFPKEPNAWRRMYSLLDVYGSGKLTRKGLASFLAPVMVGVRAYCGEGVELVQDDFLDEIFDMAHPADPAYITLSDLLACKGGELLVVYLADPGLLVARELDAQGGGGGEEEDSVMDPPDDGGSGRSRESPV